MKSNKNIKEFYVSNEEFQMIYSLILQVLTGTTPLRGIDTPRDVFWERVKSGGYPC